MGKKNTFRAAVLFSAAFFLFCLVLESSAWARAGGGRSSGSRGSRSFSSPSMPSRSAPDFPATPGAGPGFSNPQRPVGPTPGAPSSQGGGFMRSPFMQGLAGGMAGGLLGSLLFGGSGHAAPSGGQSGGGIGFLDIIIIGALLYFGWKFFMRRRRAADATAYYGGVPSNQDNLTSFPSQGETVGSYGAQYREGYLSGDQRGEGLQVIARTDPYFDEEKFKETVQDMFFRIQAGWMNRSLEGIGDMLTQEMVDYFQGEFGAMREQGRINRLENIAVRKVEPSEAWQEMGKDYVTVLFTANLLDYVVDDKTGGVLEGDKLNPVKFQEFWTFCRDIGTSAWRLAGINQVDEPTTRH